MNSRGQVADTMSWFGAMLVIILILVIFVILSFSLTGKKVVFEDNEAKIIIGGNSLQDMRAAFYLFKQKEVVLGNKELNLFEAFIVENQRVKGFEISEDVLLDEVDRCELESSGQSCNVQRNLPITDFYLKDLESVIETGHSEFNYFPQEDIKIEITLPGGEIVSDVMSSAVNYRSTLEIFDDALENFCGKIIVAGEDFAISKNKTRTHYYQTINKIERRILKNFWNDDFWLNNESVKIVVPTNFLPPGESSEVRVWVKPGSCLNE